MAYVVKKKYWFDGSLTVVRVCNTEDQAKDYCDKMDIEEKYQNESNNGVHINEYDYDEVEFEK